MIRRNWTRDELLVALKIYCELEFGQFDSRNARIQEVSDSLGRTSGALAMKLSNFASLDPSMGGRGLDGASKADAAIMQEFLAEPEKVFLEVEEAYSRLTNKKDYGLSDRPAEFVHDFNSERETERLATVKVRIVQDLFRKTVLASYSNKCAICQINVPALLVASHIVPWAADSKKRVSPTNGISFCGLHDRAFDRGYFSIADDYTVIIGEKLQPYSGNQYTELMLHSFSGKKLYLPFRFVPDQSCLKWHRSHYGFAV